MVEVDHDDVPVVDENDVRVGVSGDVGGVVEVVDVVSYWWIPLCWQSLRCCVLIEQACSGLVVVVVVVVVIVSVSA